MIRIKTIALTATAVALLASASYAQECATEAVKVGWLPKLDTDPYFQVAGAGAQDAAKEIGGEIIKLAPSQATAEAQVEIVNNLVSQGVKVIALSSNDAKGIIVPAGIGLPAAARALDEAGLSRKIKLTGRAPASLMKKYVNNGSAQVIWWNVTDLGYLTYYAAQATAQCKLTGKAGEALKAGRLGDYTVGEKGEIILGPAKIVTPANLAEFKF